MEEKERFNKVDFGSIDEMEGVCPAASKDPF
jgi:hypothetical protein